MDEKQLQFLYNEYAKNKGFKDYSEFKGLMSSEESRKLFFDDSNKELGFKDYNEFNDLLGVKKKVSGEISSLTELPSEFIEPLKQGVSPNQTKEEEKAARQLGVKPYTGVTTPTNLPKQDALRYEKEVKVKDAAINTLTDVYKQKGLKFDPSRPAAQQQIQDYIDKEQSNDLGLVEGIKDKKPYLTRTTGLGETLFNTTIDSFKEPVKSFKINTISNPNELADVLDEEIKNNPNIPESVPSNVAGYFGQLAGGLPKFAAEEYLGGPALVAAEMYWNGIANERKALYQKGLDQGMDRGKAAQMAMDNATTSAIPDFVVGAILAVGVKGHTGVLKQGTAASFKDAVTNVVKSSPKMYAIGAGGSLAKSGTQAAAGYDLDRTEVLREALDRGGDLAKMDAAFKIGAMAPYVPKILYAAAKNVLAETPKPVLDALAKKYGDNNGKIVDDVNKFAQTKSEVQDLVPEAKVASVTGLTQKVKNIQQDIDDLTARKEKTTDALKPQIDAWLKEYQDEIDFYNNQIKKVVESKDPTGVTEEVDDITGQKIGTEQYVVDGKELSQQEFEAMQGNPIGTKEVTTAEVKPTEVKELEEEYNSKSVDELIALKKKLYPSPDIETPMTKEEKLLDRVIAKKFSDKQQEIIEKRKIAEEAPRFPSYDDAQEWIKSKSKEYKSKNEFLASQEYKDALPDINALFKVEKADYSKKAKAAMQESGVKIGDRVMYDYVTPIGVETYSGQIVDRQGVPFVRFDNDQKTISGKQSVRWHKGFIKESAPKSVVEQVKPTEVKEIGADIINNTESKILLPVDELNRLRTQRETDLATGNAIDLEKNLLKNGIKEPLVITYYPEEGKARLTDGHNRLDVAKDMGAENLPIRIVYDYGEAPSSAKDFILPTEEFKPTKVKAEAQVVKPKIEKQIEPKTLSIDNKEYTTKTGRQKVVLKDNDLKVIDTKTGKEASPATRKKALDEYVDTYDFSKGKTAQENAKEAPEGLGIEELNKFTIEQSENPLEIASAYIYEEPISKFAESKDALIAEFGVGKITQESFKRWKDENLITGGMALTYFNKKEGLPLDVLAKSMSDHYGREIDPQDIANFIVKYPSGSSAALREIESPTGRLAAERFKEVTGLDLYRNMAEKIVNAEFEKKKQIEKDLIKEDYETAQQLEDAYWSAYKETDGFTKESPIGETKPTEASEKGVEEAYKDLTINQKRQIINSKFEELLKELKIEKICPT